MFNLILMSKEIFKEIIGLNEQEVKTYFTLLNVGDQPASIIAGKVNCPRSSIYPILERMSKKGIVSFYTRRKIRYYSSVGLDRIEALLREKESGYEAKAKMINENRMKLKSFLRLYRKENNPFCSRPRLHACFGEKEVEDMWLETVRRVDKIYLYGKPLIWKGATEDNLQVLEKIPNIKSVKLILSQQGNTQKNKLSVLGAKTSILSCNNLFMNEMVGNLCICGHFFIFIARNENMIYSLQTEDLHLSRHLILLFENFWNQALI